MAWCFLWTPKLFISSISHTEENSFSHPKGQDKLATIQLCPNEIKLSLMRPGKLKAVLVLICGQKLERFHPPAWKTLREGKKGSLCLYSFVWACVSWAVVKLGLTTAAGVTLRAARWFSSESALVFVCMCWGWYSSSQQQPSLFFTQLFFSVVLTPTPLNPFTLYLIILSNSNTVLRNVTGYKAVNKCS